MPIFARNVPLVSVIFLKSSLVFPILLFSSISLHCSLKEDFLFLLASLWNSAFPFVAFHFSSQLFARLRDTLGLCSTQLREPKRNFSALAVKLVIILIVVHFSITLQRIHVLVLFYVVSGKLVVKFVRVCEEKLTFTVVHEGQYTYMFIFTLGFIYIYIYIYTYTYIQICLYKHAFKYLRPKQG